jgi:hypothetical protein
MYRQQEKVRVLLMLFARQRMLATLRKLVSKKQRRTKNKKGVYSYAYAPIAAIFIY